MTKKSGLFVLMMAFCVSPALAREDGLHVTGALGSLDEEAVEAAFREHVPAIDRCYQDVTARIWYLSGKLTLKLRVAEDGRVRSAAVSESTVGNYQVERCAVQVAQRVSLPRPRGGEAEVTFPVEFPTRAPVGSWPQERVQGQVSRHRGDLLGCHAKAKPAAVAPLRITLYIGPGGKVTSAGLSADAPIDDRFGSCVVARVQGLQFDDPLGQMVKASIALD